MLNVLLYCKHVDTSKKILNKLVGKISYFRLVGIANNTLEADSIIKDTEPNIIITTESSILSLLNKKFITYQPIIVYITNQTSKIENNIIVLDYHLSFSEMTDIVLKHISYKIESTNREKVVKILQNLKFDFNLAGTLYLLDAILYVHTYKGSNSLDKLEQDVYSYVANTNFSSKKKVKWSIARAINYMYKKHTSSSYKTVEGFLGIKYPQKPTPKSLINILANRLNK